MKRILVGVGFVVVVIAAAIGVVLYLATKQPDKFRVERSIKIDAWPGVVFANLEDFHRWDAWSPWEKLDPKMKKQYKGPPKGAGAVFLWDSNKGVGRGQMTMLQARENDLLRIRLEFFEPRQTTNRLEFTLDNAGQVTQVHWSMEGTNTLMGKALCVFTDMDHLIGGDFQRGLENLKRVSEKDQAALSAQAGRAPEPSPAH